MLTVKALVQELSTEPGIEGCSLVELGTGMAWHYAGNLPDIERVGEAAIEFWRVEQRLREHLHHLGDLRSAAYSFSNQVVALFPCSQEFGLVLVCVAAKRGMNWEEWGSKVAALRKALRALHEKSAPQAKPPQ
jgi:hypothetical protein